jgi:hypothetical protein
MLQAHGFYSVKREGNQVFCLISGCWNEENVIGYVKAIQKKVNELPKNTPWIYVVNALDFEGATPSAYNKQSDFIHWCIAHNIQHRLIITNDEFKVTIAKKYQRDFHLVPTTVVATKQLAKHWLAEMNGQNIHLAS